MILVQKDENQGSKLTTELVKIAEAEAATHRLLVETKRDALNAVGGLTKATDILKTIGLPSNTEDPELRYVHAVLAGHLLLLEGSHGKAVQVINSVPEPTTRNLNYVRTAIFKGHAVAGYSRLLLGEKDGAGQTFGAVYPSAETLQTNAEAGLWAERMYFAYVQSAKGTPAYLDALRSYSRVFMYLDSRGRSTGRSRTASMKIVREFWEESAAEVQRDPMNTQLKEESLEAANYYGKNVLSRRTFPTSSENNDEVELYMHKVMETWRKTTVFSDSPLRVVAGREQVETTSRVFDQLTQAAQTTFHSSLIMRYHVLVLSALGRHTEALAAFNTYTSYVDQQLEEVRTGSAHGHVDNDEGIVEAFELAIHIQARIKNEAESAKATADKLAGYMPFTRTSDEAVLRVISTQAVAAISSAYYYYALSLKDDQHYEEAIGVALKGFAKAVDEYPEQSAQTYYEYALLTAVNGDIFRAFEIVKAGLLRDSQHVPSWHLLALLLSSQEDYQNALKTAEQAWAILAAARSLDSYSRETKSALLEVEKTRVALVEASSSIADAVVELNTVFARFHALFPTVSMDDDSQRHAQANGTSRRAASTKVNGIANGVVNGNGVSKGVPNGVPNGAPNGVPNGTLSGAPHGTTKDHRRSLVPSAKASKVAKTAAQQPLPPFERKVQARLWQWAAGLYRRAGNVSEAEQALVEAEHLEGVISADSHCELGYLMREARPLHALQEFEAALDSEPDSLGGAIGLAQLVVTHSTLRSNTSTPEEKYALFISDKDEHAAHFRAIGLLESLTSRSPGRTIPEAWWLLGKLYDITHNAEGARSALWKTVGLEETRAVRSYFSTAYDYS